MPRNGASCCGSSGGRRAVFSRQSRLRLKKRASKAIDVAGRCGVEPTWYAVKPKGRQRHGTPAETTFADWGIPTDAKR